MVRLAILLGLLAPPLWGFPSVCDMVKSDKFDDVLDFDYEYTWCSKGWRTWPCAKFEYYEPKYFIEVVSNPKETFFSGVPFIKNQLAWAGHHGPQGVDDDNGSYSFHAHVIRMPYSDLAMKGLPCGGGVSFLPCFSVMSEHLTPHWHTGSADLWQPKHLAWSLSPKACLISGALPGTNGWAGGVGGDSNMCSFPMGWMPIYPPSKQPVCTGWGIHFPRTGTVTSSDRTTASLVIASRIKSIGAEVLGSISIAGDEKWQMVIPQMSSTFREGQNLGFLRMKDVSERGRLGGNPSNYLYAIWQKKSCKNEIPLIWSSKLWIRTLKSVCRR